ncbi:hypothetical protein ACQRBF_06650 [Peptoniphilaceae bacterium SGI.131]
MKVKKLLAVFLVAAFVLVGCGGGSKNPAEASFDKFFTALKNLDYKTINELVLSGEKADEGSLKEMEKQINELTSADKDILNKVKNLVKDNSYKINSSKQEGDNYILDVSIKAKDFSTKLEDAFAKVMASMSKLMVNPNATEEESKKASMEMISSIFDTFSEAKDFVETKVNITMKKEGDAYKVDLSNEENALSFFKAYMPNFIDKLQEMMKGLGGGLQNLNPTK